MKTLIMTTGDNRLILKRYLPTLRGSGEYKGDVMVLDYGIICQTQMLDPNRAERVQELKDNGVIVYPTTCQANNFFVDRMRGYREYLLKDDNYKKYDVVMYTDGNDIIFHGPIQSLFDQAKDVICYAKEPPRNTLRRWESLISQITGVKEAAIITRNFESIADNAEINNGMIVGPPTAMLDLFNFILEASAKFNVSVACDQQFMNIFFYYNKYPSKEVGYEWNYIHDIFEVGLIGKEVTERIPKMVDGKAYALEDGRQIFIEHRTGADGYWCTADGWDLLEYGGRNIMRAEYDYRNNPQRLLVVTTGKAKIILNRWLPSLRNTAKFTGDVLVLDYGSLEYFSWRKLADNNDEVMKKLSKEKGVTVVPATQEYPDFFIDRVRFTREYLMENDRWREYDAIMIIDADDVVFYGPIQPLFDKALGNKLCYAKEHFSNKLGIWNGFYYKGFIKKDFDGLHDKTMINGGMVVGASKCIMDYLNYAVGLVEKYGSEAKGTCDQAFLNLFVYYEKYPNTLEVGDEWNYTHAVIGGYPCRIPEIKDGKAYKLEDGKPVYIEHRTGTGWRFWDSVAGIHYLYNDVDIPIDAEYLPFQGMMELFPRPKVIARDLFPKGKNHSNNSNIDMIVEPKRVPNYLFPENKEPKKTWLFPK